MIPNTDPVTSRSGAKTVDELFAFNVSEPGGAFRFRLWESIKRIALIFARSIASPLVVGLLVLSCQFDPVNKLRVQQIRGKC